MARIQPTPEQLQSAWQRLWRKGWPPNLEQTLQDPVRAALVRSDAVRQVLRETAQPAPWCAPPIPPRATPAPIHSATRPPLLDRKRAAAGEREDD